MHSDILNFTKLAFNSLKMIWNDTVYQPIKQGMIGVWVWLMIAGQGMFTCRSLGVFDWAVSWSTLKSWSTFRIRLVLHEISWSTKDVSRNSGDIFREVNHVMALLRQLRRCSSRQVLQILINSK